MKEQFDRELRNHIKDTFDHYDDLMADDGWNQFKKHRNRKRRGLVLWYALPSGIAAALAVIWLFNAMQNDIVQPQNQPLAENKVKIESKISKTEQLEQKAVVSKNPVRTQDNENAIADKYQLPASETPVEYTVASKAIKERELIIKPIAGESKMTVHTSRSPSVRSNTDKIFLGDDDLNRNATPQSLASIDVPETMMAIASFDLPTANPIELDVKKVKEKAFSIAVDANTYYSFTSAGVSDHVNIGIGLLSELRLAKNFSINSGIAFNQQDTRFDGDKDLGSKRLAVNAQMSAASVPSSLETEARLTGFDIPINIKYSVLLGKAKTFFTTGVSSYSLINQRYTNQLSVVNYSLKGAPTTSTITDVEKDSDGIFSNFKFARTVNFSFGVLYPVSERNSVSVEPFIKYPINGLGNEDLKIGSGGISFKYTFSR